MKLLFIVFATIITLAMSVAFQFDNRYPISTKIRYKYRVKDNSFLRKIIRFKDTPENSCIYFKIIPIYINLLLSIISIIILITNLLFDNIIANLINDNTIYVIFIIITVCCIIYYSIMMIWWVIEDNKEMKFPNDKRND